MISRLDGSFIVHVQLRCWVRPQACIQLLQHVID